MATYKYGSYIQHVWYDGVNGTSFYAIYKKTFFGWKEFDWWKQNDKGYNKMMETVESLRKAGNVVYPS